MIINNNIASLRSQGALFQNNRALGQDLHRLSTGLRINNASDDAAGLAISEGLRTQVRGQEQAKRNTLDGISALNIAEGAMNELHNILQRQRELAVQSSTETYSDTERKYMQIEFERLSEEKARIMQVTNFNGMKLLDSSREANSIFVQRETQTDINGTRIAGRIGSSLENIGNAMSRINTNTNVARELHGETLAEGWHSAGAAAIRENVSSKLEDIFGTDMKSIQNFSNANWVAAESALAALRTLADESTLNGLMNKFGVRGNATDSVGEAIEAVSHGLTAAAHTMVAIDETLGNLAAQIEAVWQVLGGTDNTDDGYDDFENAIITSIQTAVNRGGFAAGTIHELDEADVQNALRDAIRAGFRTGVETQLRDMAISESERNSVVSEITKIETELSRIHSGGATAANSAMLNALTSVQRQLGEDAAANGTPSGLLGVIDSAARTRDIENARDAFVASLNNLFTNGASGADFNMFNADQLEAYLNAAEDFRNAVRNSTDLTNSERTAIMRSFNELRDTVDVVNTIAATSFMPDDRHNGNLWVDANGMRGLDSINVSYDVGDFKHGADILTRENSELAITAIDDAIRAVSEARADIGANINRLETTINNLTVSITNQQAAESNIRDLDFAKQSSNFTKNQILTQSATAMLTQANQTTQGALQLIR